MNTGQAQALFMTDEDFAMERGGDAELQKNSYAIFPSGSVLSYNKPSNLQEVSNAENCS